MLTILCTRSRMHVAYEFHVRFCSFLTTACVYSIFSLKIVFLRFHFLFFFHRKLQVSQFLSTDKWNWIRSFDRWGSSRYVYWFNEFKSMTVNFLNSIAWQRLGKLSVWLWMQYIFFSSPRMRDRVLNRMEFFLDSDVDQNLSLFTPIGH